MNADNTFKNFPNGLSKLCAPMLRLVILYLTPKSKTESKRMKLYKHSGIATIIDGARIVNASFNDLYLHRIIGTSTTDTKAKFGRHPTASAKHRQEKNTIK